MFVYYSYYFLAAIICNGIVINKIGQNVNTATICRIVKIMFILIPPSNS
jgi:methylthioribose-1-phosphate isomerase